jgi:hypothetical protein
MIQLQKYTEVRGGCLANMVLLQVQEAQINYLDARG